MFLLLNSSKFFSMQSRRVKISVLYLSNLSPATLNDPPSASNSPTQSGMHTENHTLHPLHARTLETLYLKL